MHPDSPPPPPRVLPPLVEALRTDLLAAQYTIERTEDLLGEVAVGALRREDPIPARRVLRADPDPAGALLGLFTLGEQVTARRADELLPTLGAAGAVELGLLGPLDAATDLRPATPGTDLRPAAPGTDSGTTADVDPATVLRALVDLAPYSAQDDLGQISWWIASDPSELATGAALHPEHVLGVGGASLTLARITPREPVGSVLDLGCGGGIQALHASRHAQHVVATDLSARALAFAAFNAALNEVAIELRLGSLLDPVAGEQFDLIVSNPPFVITPRRTRGGRDGHGADGADSADRDGHGADSADRDSAVDPEDADGDGGWTYRDGGRTGDALLGELLAALPAHLTPGGSAVLLGNWEIHGTAHWDAHPRAWLAPAVANGLDCWVLQRDREDPAEYAATWVRDGGITPRDARWTPLMDAWLTDLAGRDVAGIGFGYVLLRRPPTGAEGSLRTEEVPGTGGGSLGAHLSAGLRMIGHLRGLSDEDLADARPRRAADLIERRHLVPGAWDPTLIELVQGAGFARTVPADQVLAATVGALDGTLTLGQTVGAVCALTGDEPGPARERMLSQARELLVTGMLEL